MKCTQKTKDGRRCDLPAAFRYTWPGSVEAGACLAHAAQLTTVAAAIGLHLQLIPLPGFPEIEYEPTQCTEQHPDHEADEHDGAYEVDAMVPDAAGAPGRMRCMHCGVEWTP